MLPYRQLNAFANLHICAGGQFNGLGVAVRNSNEYISHIFNIMDVKTGLAPHGSRKQIFLPTHSYT